MKHFEEDQTRTKKGEESCWPEADTIRLLTGKAESGHHIPYPKEKPFKYQAFPRAQFGLPIQFRFAPKDSGKDPDPVTLLPKGKDGLAPPLILKPLAINQKESVGMVMVLRQPKIEALSLLGDRKPLPDVTDEQSIYPTATYSNNPLQDRVAVRTHRRFKLFYIARRCEHFVRRITKTNINAIFDRACSRIYCASKADA